MPKSVESLMKFCADDAKIYKAIESIQDISTIQDDINRLYQWSETWPLPLNTTKCKCIHYGKNNPQHLYSIGSTPLAVDDTEKDVEVTFDPSLDFRTQISNMISKANTRVGIIKRSFSRLSIQSFKLLYKSLARPILEYCSVIWYPIFKTDAQEIEKVQHRATKLVHPLRNLSYNERLKSLNLTTLEYRRKRVDMLKVFRIANKMDNIEFKDFFIPNKNPTRGHKWKIDKPRATTSVCQNSFLYRVVNDWNTLLEEVAECTTINSFKNALKKAWIKILSNLNMNECIPKPILSKLPPIATNGAHPLCATKHFIVPLPVPLRLGQWDLTSKYIISHFLQAITEIFLPPYTYRHSTGFKQGGRAEQPNGPRHSQLSLPGWFPHKTQWNSKIRHPFSIPTPQENTHMHPSRNSRHQEKITQLHTNTLHRMHLHRGHGHHNQEHQTGHRHPWKHYNTMRSSPSLLHHHSHEHHPLKQSPETKRKNHKTTLHPALQHNADTSREDHRPGKLLHHREDHKTPSIHTILSQCHQNQKGEENKTFLHQQLGRALRWGTRITGNNTKMGKQHQYIHQIQPNIPQAHPIIWLWRRNNKITIKVMEKGTKGLKQSIHSVWNPLFSWQLIIILM